ncbi:hypothetical protein Bca52824_064437 [Brassica carinata]|uniref:Uncharacterized protein n=1 Tax=Brassica carinata TaxID=52824 RepID=A0A8X7U8L5_BRACI|nr:hypothetical protein Bca52824_064437 [Brassica carinata]
MVVRSQIVLNESEINWNGSLGVVRWIAGPRGSGSVESGSVTYGVKLCRVLRDWLVTFHCGLSVDWTESCTGWMRVVTDWIWGCRAECVLSDQDMISDWFWDASKAGTLSVLDGYILIELAGYDGWESMEIARMEYDLANTGNGTEPLRVKLDKNLKLGKIGNGSCLVEESEMRTYRRSYTLSPVYEAATRTIDENAPTTTTKADTEEVDSREVVLPGLNLLYVGSELHPFDIGACLQARQLVAQIADATDASAILSP